jgi:ABC-2 type transport system ATP-binding protein
MANRRFEAASSAVPEGVRSATVRPGPDVVVLNQLTKVYQPTPRWMRLLARTAIRNSVLALDHVDLIVREGEICAIVGPNGAGKTTLFRTIVGLTTPTTGGGSVFGFDIERESEDVRQVVGWMPAEDRSLLMRATCQENLHLHGRLQGMTKTDLRARISETLEITGIAEKRDSIVATLSSGMKARLQLARALLAQPPLLILDEPTAAIDPVAAHALLRLITDLVETHRLAVLISSHRLEEIEALRSNVVLLQSGQVRYAGDLDDLRREWGDTMVELEFATASVALRAAASLVAHGLETQIHGEVTVRCRLPDQESLGQTLTAIPDLMSQLRRVREVPVPLRDLIANIYSQARLTRSQT